MLDKWRLEIIEGLIQERNRHVDPETKEINYQLYDEAVYQLNDNGHIDWLVDMVKKQQKEIEELREEKSFFLKAYTEKIMQE